MQLTPMQSARLVEVLRKAKLSTEGLKPQSPWSFESPRAEAIRMAVMALDPALATELSADVQPSLEYVALMARAEKEDVSIESLPENLKAEVMLRHGAELNEQQAKREADYLAGMAQAADELQRARGIDPTAAAQPRNWQERQMQEFRRMEQLERQAMAAAGKR